MANSTGSGGRAGGGGGGMLFEQSQTAKSKCRDERGKSPAKSSSSLLLLPPPREADRSAVDDFALEKVGGGGGGVELMLRDGCSEAALATTMSHYLHRPQSPLHCYSSGGSYYERCRNGSGDSLATMSHDDDDDDGDVVDAMMRMAAEDDAEKKSESLYCGMTTTTTMLLSTPPPPTTTTTTTTTTSTTTPLQPPKYKLEKKLFSSTPIKAKGGGGHIIYNHIGTSSPLSASSPPPPLSSSFASTCRSFGSGRGGAAADSRFTCSPMATTTHFVDVPLLGAAPFSPSSSSSTSAAARAVSNNNNGVETTSGASATERRGVESSAGFVAVDEGGAGEFRVGVGASANSNVGRSLLSVEDGIDSKRSLRRSRTSGRFHSNRDGNDIRLPLLGFLLAFLLPPVGCVSYCLCLSSEPKSPRHRWAIRAMYVGSLLSFLYSLGASMLLGDLLFQSPSGDQVGYGYGFS